MKVRIERTFRYCAVTILFVALVLNIKITLTDPFLLMSEAVIAQTTTSTTSSTTSNTTGSTVLKSAGCPCTPYDFDNKLLYLKTCIPLVWQQKLVCDDAATNKCCKASDQKSCSGGPLNFPPDYN